MLNNVIYNPKFEKEYWWKLANVRSAWDTDDVCIESPIAQYTPATVYEKLYDMDMEDNYPSLITGTGANIKVIQPVADIINLIVKRFNDHYCFCTSDDTQASGYKEAKAFTYKLFNLIEYTYKKYQKVIDLYNDNYATLMRELSMTTESGSRYNDTPQEAEVSLSYEENQFTSNLTKSKTVTTRDSDTPIAKIEEIFRNYRNVLLDWLNEFDSLFVEVHNV